MLIFFGDPETKGDGADAQACLRMAWSMQRRLLELNAQMARRRRSSSRSSARMGINTGYCNVGNFGSADRMDYTIIGAEANLAARLQSIAEPGGIVVSYETYALARDVIAAHALAPITMKGISREVIPYSLDNVQRCRSAEATSWSSGSRGSISIWIRRPWTPRGSTGSARSCVDALTKLDRRRPKPAR